jgi:formylglycine-generating enzyme required for sulfatase activity
MFTRIVVGVVAMATVALSAAANANVFQLSGGATSLQFVPVGDPGNAADSTGFGSVPYAYRMGTFDVTLAQYTAFLNAVAQTDTYGLYNPFMGVDYSTQGISQSGNSGSFSYAVTGSAASAANMPAFAITWGDAARFCNWLQNGQPTGIEDNSTTENGSYELNGAITPDDFQSITRSTSARYVIPSEDEWYKAAYYVGGGTNAGYWSYPTKSLSGNPPGNSLALALTNSNQANFYSGGYTDPVNHLTSVGTFFASPGPYGTFDMGGDVFQWNEANPSPGGFRGARGGAYALPVSYLQSSGENYFDPTDINNLVGFRVVDLSPNPIPEPGSLALLLSAAAILGVWRARRQFRAN